jgi:hypothetical protein
MAHKIIVLCLLVPAACLVSQAALLPDDIGAYHRTAAKAVPISDQALWKEYGFQEGETATYQSGDSQYTVTAWRLQDATGALGAFEWQRPADAKPSPLAALAAETADGVLLVHNNYLLAFAGHTPDNAELVAVAGGLKNLDSSPLPSLPGFLPAAGEVANSRKYVPARSAWPGSLPVSRPRRLPST